jgi:hypothetical protein
VAVKEGDDNDDPLTRESAALLPFTIVISLNNGPRMFTAGSSFSLCDALW